MSDMVLQTDDTGLAGGSAAQDVRRRVTDCFRTTAEEQDRVLQPLADDLPLLASGLDSLCFAIIVAQLEDQLGLDPFSELEDAFFPVTFGEFVRLYEEAALRAD